MRCIRHGPNRKGRDYVVGDVHGQYAQLMEALERVDFDVARDRLFCVGDLVDRGEASLACLALALEPWCFAVKGNHEQMAITALAEGGGMAWDLWQRNGGNWVFLDGVEEARSTMNAARPHLPLAREICAGQRRLGVVHADPPDDWGQIEQTPAEHLLWSRRRFRRDSGGSLDSTRVEGVDAVVVGHTIVEAPLWLGNVLHLDTGACAGGRLTLAAVDDILDAIP